MPKLQGPACCSPLAIYQAYNLLWVAVALARLLIYAPAWLLAARCEKHGGTERQTPRATGLGPHEPHSKQGQVGYLTGSCCQGRAPGSWRLLIGLTAMHCSIPSSSCHDGVALDPAAPYALPPRAFEGNTHCGSDYLFHLPLRMYQTVSAGISLITVSVTAAESGPEADALQGTPQYNHRSTSATVQPPQYNHRRTTTAVQPPQNNHCITATAEQPPQYNHRITATTEQPPQYNRRSTTTAVQPPQNNHRSTTTTVQPPQYNHRITRPSF
ncbi:hypothetical protein P4O66_010219 [Electrophorus voltai]|uniref:Uncharacterized protein n=1 Tax=Electrophorus voltai TaxID=2609070 RepID=A0AAD9DTT0_9TELE|nr:hypothetical protein P4O66_010219 [Electrophorus voltai]